ncbi:MAG: hypothetical protein FWD50_05870 [Betaproteobacteria bacterium]|nr:hypothetical protein [Betaproteobacteria bacterium]
MTNQPLLHATGQTQKLIVASILVTIGGVLLGVVTKLVDAESSPTVFVALLVAGGVLLLCGFLCPAASIRCPHCNLRWVQWSMGYQPYNMWLRWLLTFVSCPRCGFAQAGDSRQPDAP